MVVFEKNPPGIPYKPIPDGLLRSVNLSDAKFIVVYDLHSFMFWGFTRPLRSTTLDLPDVFGLDPNSRWIYCNQYKNKCIKPNINFAKLYNHTSIRVQIPETYRQWLQITHYLREISTTSYIDLAISWMNELSLSLAKQMKAKKHSINQPRMHQLVTFNEESASNILWVLIHSARRNPKLNLSGISKIDPLQLSYQDLFTVLHTSYTIRCDLFHCDTVHPSHTNTVLACKVTFVILQYMLRLLILSCDSEE